jgi:cystathionine gamma-synthase
VHRLAVADTAGWIEMCGAADLIWLESPSNPLLTVADLDAICAAPRKRGAILGVDNTFATPLNQRPLALGADVAVQSVTKFIGGHSDLLGGIVTVRDANLLAALRQARELAGATPGTLETFLAVRGARTLALRLERAQRNAMTLAERLARHPNVTLTRYPGLASHPTHDAARRKPKASARLSRSMCVATPPPPTPYAPDCSSSNMPLAWARSSPRSNGGPAFQGRSTCLRRCYG